MVCIFKETSILGSNYVMRLHFCGVVASDCSSILLRRVPFPGELSCVGFPEKKSRNTGKLYSEASADAAWAAFFS